MTDHGNNMELFGKLDWRSFPCPLLVVLGMGNKKNCKAIEAARFICPSTKCIQPLIFCRFITFRIKLNWSLQEQQHKKKYSYFLDPFNLKNYGFSWATSIHPCSVAVAPDPPAYRTFEAESLSSNTGGKKKKEGGKERKKGERGSPDEKFPYICSFAHLVLQIHLGSFFFIHSLPQINHRKKNIIINFS